MENRPRAVRDIQSHTVINSHTTVIHSRTQSHSRIRKEGSDVVWSSLVQCSASVYSVQCTFSVRY